MCPKQGAKMEPSFQRKFAKFTNRKNPSKYMQIHAYFRPPEWGTFFGPVLKPKENTRKKSVHAVRPPEWDLLRSVLNPKKFKPNQKWPQKHLRLSKLSWHLESLLLQEIQYKKGRFSLHTTSSKLACSEQSQVENRFQRFQ